MSKLPYQHLTNGRMNSLSCQFKVTKLAIGRLVIQVQAVWLQRQQVQLASVSFAFCSEILTALQHTQAQSCTQVYAVLWGSGRRPGL